MVLATHRPPCGDVTSSQTLIHLGHVSGYGWQLRASLPMSLRALPLVTRCLPRTLAAVPPQKRRPWRPLSYTQGDTQQSCGGGAATFDSPGRICTFPHLVCQAVARNRQQDVMMLLRCSPSTSKESTVCAVTAVSMTAHTVLSLLVDGLQRSSVIISTPGHD